MASRPNRAAEPPCGHVAFQKISRSFPRVSPPCDTALTFRHTDGRGLRGSGWRKAVSSGLRGPYPGPEACDGNTPASAGTCRIEVNPGKGLSREGRNRLPLQPAASDPHRSRGWPAPRRMRRHPGRRPDETPAAPACLFCRALAGEGGFGLPASRTRRHRPGLLVDCRRWRVRLAPGRRLHPSPAGRGRTRQAKCSNPQRAFRPRPASPVTSGPLHAPGRRRVFRARGLGVGCRCCGAIAPPSDLPPCGGDARPGRGGWVWCGRDCQGLLLYTSIIRGGRSLPGRRASLVILGSEAEDDHCTGQTQKTRKRRPLPGCSKSRSSGLWLSPRRRRARCRAPWRPSGPRPAPFRRRAPRSGAPVRG